MIDPHSFIPTKPAFWGDLGFSHITNSRAGDLPMYICTCMYVHTYVPTYIHIICTYVLYLCTEYHRLSGDEPYVCMSESDWGIQSCCLIIIALPPSALEYICMYILRTDVRICVYLFLFMLINNANWLTRIFVTLIAKITLQRVSKYLSLVCNYYICTCIVHTYHTWVCMILVFISIPLRYGYNI